jgi:NACalpha-BTF3-like transcription factor
VLAKKAAKKKEALETSFESLKEKFAKEETATSPLLSEGDLKLISTAQTNLSQGDILRMYVKNWAELDLKQRRKVMGHIQA